VIIQLALKHRQNNSQRQRIIVFTCSPIADDEKSLIKLAKRMKKNNISVDFIAFGNLESDTKSKLEAFNENVKGGEGSHLIVVPPGPNLLSDVLLTSPILAGEGAGAGGSGAGENGVAGADGGAGGAGAGTAGGTGYEFGIDPSVDPELAMALRMSMEEETNRLERQRKEREEAEAAQKEKERLEGIPEEGAATGQSSGADEEAASGEKKDEKKDGEGGGGGAAEADKMDTA
jgi:26S proteasome regulatory subunit N10